MPPDVPESRAAREPRTGGGTGRGSRRRGGRRRPPGGRGPSSRRPSPQEVERRRALVPAVRWPSDLPVVERREDIARAIAEHQVVVVAGETGSGKTTQLPKICLELGRGVHGAIGHTQPRRIAARSVAERIAEELEVPLGGVVGYQVRFTEQAGADTLIKVMTDGILLNELQRDPDLLRYDTLIIDEAHERSLTIDFILGYLKRLLPRRPDLKVIITSATIDPEAFARHFGGDAGPVPVLEVSGRTYPVEVRYRPLDRPTGRLAQDGTPITEAVDQVTGVVEAVEELWTEDTGRDGPADILVFFSGEREIRDAADALEALRLPGTEVLPLYGRLSAAEQHRVFTRHGGRRIVLATNVAETSLTVPGIRYVVDTGLARISRYSQRLKVQRLPIEPISRASAQQRSGRCGRLADGVAIRLWSEEEHEARPEFTDPEIQRTGLAAVILQMTALGLGDVARFPFLDPPDKRQVGDGVRLLQELHAIDETAPADQPRRRLTDIGRALARLPLDPRMARMIVEADRQGALGEVLVVVAALSLQDVRERPADARTQADQAHARFRDEDSDFLSVLALWRYLQEQQRELSGSAFRRLCKREYLHYLRIREWQDLHAQLRRNARDLGMRTSDVPATPDRIHRSLLTGLLGHIGLRDRDTRDYLGARQARFAIQPGSTLFRRRPDWVMAAELVETSRLWARTCAMVDPEWIEQAGAHLVKRQYSEPHWSRGRAGAVARERVTLYGVPLVVDRRVAYGGIDPETARELFIRHALVEGDWDTRHHFLRDNLALIERLGDLETRARRRDLVVDEETLVAFYDERVPADVVSGAHFDSWWKKQRHRTPELLTFTEDFLRSEDAGVVDEHAYPPVWQQGGLTLRLGYAFEPGTDDDGVTVHIPLPVLNQVRDEGWDWLVPGMREDLATAAVRALPKAVRRHLVPAPDRARAALELMDPAAGPFAEELARALRQLGGVVVDPADVDAERLPTHLRMRFQVEDGDRVLGRGTDLSALQEELGAQVRTTMAQAAAEVERRGLRTWDLGELPEEFTTTRDGHRVTGYPALVDTGEGVDVQVLGSAAERDAATRVGTRRLLLQNTTVPWPRLLGLLSNADKLALAQNPHGSVPELLDDALAAAVDSVVAQMPGSRVRTPEEFERALTTVRQQVVPRVVDLVEALAPALREAQEVRLSLAGMAADRVAPLKADLQAQLDALIRPGFVADLGVGQVRHLARWLRAMRERAEKAPLDLPRDAQRAEEVAVVEREYRDLLAGLPPLRRADPDARAIAWMIQELRVSLFAQRLGTAHPVSAKRIYTAMDAVEDAAGPSD